MACAHRVCRQHEVVPIVKWFWPFGIIHLTYGLAYTVHGSCALARQSGATIVNAFGGVAPKMSTCRGALLFLKAC